ncbi:uncharacterized protein LOC129005955 [Macrosteles quadrilineatus]|uniref:uncharacterized protein LOC128988475 n=1 Tax=Macrosteles quadrilineatus TaxID=74068 RepID=UPI0023E0B16A|nr:uncharacterized protein LOC128988475 [Macrosteles quadrilineatus]XP_054290970.1 uncharacterized protein LOC129005955 [Macrosteles quadrilineatus]
MKTVVLQLLTFIVSYSSASVVMTGGGTFKLIMGYSIPVDVPMPMGINYVHNFQFQYPTVTNASQVAYVQQGARDNQRQQRAVTRKHVYNIIQDMLLHSGLDGSCLLRSVCESSESPIMHSGLIGELLQTLLTPQDPDEDSEYGAAWRAGLEGQNCSTLYPLCPRGLTMLDQFSHYYM